jgi:hypothetical protein
MHAHSVVWFAILLAFVVALYRRVETSPLVLGGAALLYAIDDAHGPAVSWISNRNALIATAFGALAVTAHVAWRRDGRRWGAIVAPAALFFGFGAGEFVSGALAYVVAFALCLDRGRPLSRALGLLPSAAVVVVWRVAHTAGGYGATGSGAYLDPLRDPAAFLAALPEKVLVLVHGQLGVPPSDLAFFGPPEDRPLLLALAGITLAAAVLVFAPIVKRDAVARFWALGALLATIPVSASFPSDRLLLFVGIGAAGLVARLLATLVDARVGPRPKGVRMMVALGFAAIHLVVAPLLLPFRSAQMLVAGHASTESARVLDEVADLAEKTVIVVNAPIDILASYVQAERAWQGRPTAARFYWLASASSALEVRRPDPSALVIRPREGFLYGPLERHYRGDTRALSTGTRVTLAEMTATVQGTLADGRPSAVRFDFDAPLDSPRYVVLAWRNGEYERIDAPSPGETRTFPREDFGKILVSSVIE